MSADLTCGECRGSGQIRLGTEEHGDDLACLRCGGVGRRSYTMDEWDALKVDRDWLDTLLRRGLRAWRKCRKERDHYREALTTIAAMRQEADEWEHPDFDWRILALKQEHVARVALGLPRK